MREALEAHLSTLQTEVLAHTVSFTGLPEAEHREEVEVEGTRLGLELRRAPVAQGVEA